jgi:hypothetical protein
MSVAALISPCSFLMLDSIRVMRARSTSTNIYVSSVKSKCAWLDAPYLSLGHSPQRLDDGQLRLQVWCFIKEAHHCLHHLGGGLFELSMLLGEEQHLLVHQVPVLRILGYCDDGDNDSGRRREI